MTDIFKLYRPILNIINHTFSYFVVVLFGINFTYKLEHLLLVYSCMAGIRFMPLTLFLVECSSHSQSSVCDI